MKIQWNKKQKSITAVYAIMLFLYDVLYFVIPFPKSLSCYFLFFFCQAAFLVSYCIVQIAFNGTETLKSKVYGFPIFRIGYLYLAAQIGGSILFYLINIFTDIPEWITVVFSILLLSLTSIGVILTDNTRDVIEQQEAEWEAQTKPMMYFRLDVADLESVCPQDGETKEMLRHFVEQVRYSDPVSSEDLTEIEDRLRAETESLRQMFLQGQDGKKQIERLEHLLEDRNRRCKEYKR